ncbi:cysteine-rich receptor-like protein kinase 15 isoform X3 [Aegilops tauschii subsp. strangulata]|uniref:cysteine-rich receptor-like protein kinase 15 isoform X3 n=1 Tax=Aegilops tauschii subsp. strangulata TaxID=200361 RepID=UPI001ABC7F02|nr:cysteine-rich receptor-like protein kinase 10 isoform X3 [Aegilops tauschii subsp. strangulata]
MIHLGFLAMAPGFMPRRLIAFLLIFCVLRRGKGGSTTSPGQQNLLCGSQKYEMGSPYDDHVRWLLPNLTESVIKDGAISGWADAGNVASDPGDGVGCVAMCYADHSREDCAQCLRYVAGRFLQGKACPNARNATAFYDTCMVWYYQLSTVVGFGYLYVAFRSDLGLDLTGSQEAASFWKKRRLLLQDLSSQAIASKQYAAASSTEYGYGSAVQSIYGLVQCQRFLSRENCSSCLKALALFVTIQPSTQNMTIGAVKTYWCYIRYGTEKFADYISEYMATLPSPNDAWATAPAMAPTPPPPHQGWATMIRVIIASCISIVLVTGIMLLLGYLFRGRMFCVTPRQSIQLGSLAPMQFSASQLRDATNNFTDPLGNGAFGTVYKGTIEGKEVAVKKLHSKDGVIEKSGDVLDWSGRYKIVQGICSGLHYLHHELDQEQNIVHLDLKANNVLVSRGEGGDITSVKIADFGISKFFRMDLTHSYMEQIIGPKAYMAPEYLGKGRISPKADIYSFGVLILEIVTGQCAKVDDSSDDFITWVHGEWSKRDVRALIYVHDESLSSDCIVQAQNCIEIAMDCIQEDPNSRPDAEMIRQRLLRV